MFNRGLIFAILSAFMFSIMNVMVKEISQTMATGEIVFVRSIWRNYYFNHYEIMSH